MSKYQFTTVDTIFSKFSRDLGEPVNENDFIEWIGDALGFMKVKEINEEAITFLEVKDHQTDLPSGFKFVIQLAKDNGRSTLDNNSFKCKEEEKNIIEEKNYSILHEEDLCNTDRCNFIDTIEPNLCLRANYLYWTNSYFYRSRFIPIRLSNNTFFNSLVAKEKNFNYSNRNCYGYEYTIAGHYPNIKIRTSFKSGIVALSYVRSRIDDETGYPLIPDDIIYITAITYYIKWKIAERNRWQGKEGFEREAREAEERWLKYVLQAKNDAKMPSTIDDYQNLLEQSLYIVPNVNKYYKFFGQSRYGRR